MGKASDFLNAQIGGEGETKVGIAGFTMLARVRNSFEYSSEVPTTFLEDGSSVEDTIILNSVPLTIEGVVSDTYVKQTALQEINESVASTAGAISIYLPERSQSATQAVASVTSGVTDALSVVDSLIDSGAQVSELLGSAGLEGKTLRERFVDTMESLHYGRQLVDIEMPYRTFSNMRINVTFDTDNKDDALKFKIEAKEVRVADEALSDVSSLIKNASPALGGQDESQTDKGVQEGTSVDTSLLGTILGIGG